MRLPKFWIGLALFSVAFGGDVVAAVPAQLRLVGEWQVHAFLPPDPAAGRSASSEATLTVTPPQEVLVEGERHPSLPVFNASAPGWVKGLQLKGVRAQETTTPYLLNAKSVIVRAGVEPSAQTFEEGKDYLLDGSWGTLGRKEGGRIEASQPVYITYRYTPLRLDAVIRTPNGQLELRTGEPRAAAPKAPEPKSGETRVGTIWLPAKLTKLSQEHLFSVLESEYPEPPKASPTVAEQWLPNTMKKLKAKQPLKVLAWGDSVTDGGYVPEPQKNRWQEQFIARLRQRFPENEIVLVTEAWGGRNTSSYLGEPPGSPHNYQEKVLAVKPDLIVSEFVNDAGLNPAQVEERYAKLLTDFRGIGAEWIILTPHYVRPDWMGLDRERDIDNDPRPYVAGLRQFSEKHHVPLAEGSKRYGRLWRQGIPYTTVMLNSINHPDAFGMKLFADALMELFP